MIEPLTTLSHIDADTPCRCCGYNLRGLNTGGHCPECNWAIIESLHGDLLQYSDPDWIDRVKHGLDLRFWGILLVLASLVLGPCLTFLVIVLFFPGFLIAYGGALHITAPEPNVITDARAARSRRIVRYCLTFPFAYIALEFTAAFTSTTAPMFAFLMLLRTSVLLAWFVGELVLLSYMSHLASPIPHPTHTAAARKLVWRMGVVMCLLLGGLTIAAVGMTMTTAAAPLNTTSGAIPTSSSNAEFLAMVGGVLTLVGLLGLFLFGIRLLALLRGMAACMGDLARLARNSMASSSLLADSPSTTSIGSATQP